MTDGVGEENYSYDTLGRVTQVQKKIYNVTYTTAYTYNLAGEVATMTYPSGRVVKNEYDAIGRLQNVKNNATGASYTSSATYNTANQVTSFSYGNGVAASFGYSAQRLQLTSLSYTKSGTTHLSLSYNYSQSGNNNGQIAGITDNSGTPQAGRSVTYAYDSLNRLKTAVTTGSTTYPQWGLSWTYDRYGNRTAQTRTHGTTAPQNSVTVSASTNRITQMGSFTFYYDSNGNSGFRSPVDSTGVRRPDLTEDDLYKYKGVYPERAGSPEPASRRDAENRLVELRQTNDALVATYAYDGNSLRVIKVVGADRTWYLYAGTQVISEFEDAASNNYSAGTTPGQAGSDTYAVLLYQHPDHLTTRATTDNSGLSSNQQAHYPYGEGWYGTGTADPSVLKKFTSYEKDTEASAGQLHYAIFREQGARIGRFLRPDPVHGRAGDPQFMNRYQYVGGDPIVRTDPEGLWCIWYGVWSASDRLCEASENADAEFARMRGMGGGGGVAVGASGPGGDNGRLAGTPPFWGGGGVGCSLTPGFFPGTQNPACGGSGLGGGNGDCRETLRGRSDVQLCNNGDLLLRVWECEGDRNCCLEKKRRFLDWCYEMPKRNHNLEYTYVIETNWLQGYAHCCGVRKRR